MGLLRKAIDAGVGHRKTLETLSDELFPGLGDVRAKQWKFWTLLVLSSVIAAGGVIGDSTPAVIGAMIVAPLAMPIYGVALAGSVGSHRGMRDSLALLLSGILVNIGVGVLAGLLFFNRVPIGENPQSLGRTSPTMLDLIVAVATGLAGSFAFVRRDVSDVLAGVAIAISLVPVLAVVGITLGSGEFDLALGALVLFLTNVAAILIAGALVFTAAGYDREAIQASPVVRVASPRLHRRACCRPHRAAGLLVAGHVAARGVGEQSARGGRGMGRRHGLGGHRSPVRRRDHRLERDRRRRAAADRRTAGLRASQRPGARTRPPHRGAWIGRAALMTSNCDEE